MKITFCGSGSAFTVSNNNYQSNILITSKSGKILLIDCGTDIRHSLFNLGLSAESINAVYISHLHADHIGGLEWFAINRLFSKPTLFIHENICKDLWLSLKNGLEHTNQSKMFFENYFSIQSVRESFQWEELIFNVIQLTHVGYPPEGMMSYGLNISNGNSSIVITTDSKYQPNTLMKYYINAKLIFQDCETDQVSGAHAHYNELLTLPIEIRKKMWLYHYNDGTLPDDSLFAGFVKKSQEFFVE